MKERKIEIKAMFCMGTCEKFTFCKVHIYF